MRLTCAQAAKLVRLDAGESLPRSQLSKGLLYTLQKADVVRMEKSGSSYVVRGIPGKLASFVEHHWGVRDLARYAQANPTNRSRELLADIAGDSKALPNRPFDGIFIRSFDNCFLANKPLNSSPPGTAVLITVGNLPHLRVETPYLIAVENAKCLWHFEKAKRYFPDLTGLDYALVLRWHWGGAWRQWLDGWRGQLLYFPDYDPAGLRIFATEVLPHRPSARLLIPQDFETILQVRGERDLYLKQGKFLPVLDEHAELARLCRALRKARKAFEQESLLS
jgi:hypothetical protein